MKLNEQGLWKLIDQRIRAMGLTYEDVNIHAFYVNVRSTNQTEELGQDTVVLVNEEIDVPYTAQVIIDGGDANKLETSKEDYEKLSYAGNQFFQDRITILTANYGLVFVPYRLEFLRISPNKCTGVLNTPQNTGVSITPQQP